MVYSRSGDHNSSPDLDKKIKVLHHKMVFALSGKLGPSKITEWGQFHHMLNVDLSETEIAETNSIQDVCTKLEKRGIISYGHYEELKSLFSSIEHQTCCDIVDDYSEQIKRLTAQPGI